jgi:acyl carrier protein
MWLGMIRELRMNQFMDDQIKAFIVENFFFGDTRREIGINDSLIENDIIDSTGILELVAFVEDQYNIRAEDSDITPANFDSIANLRRFVISKTNVTKVA